MRRVFFRMIVLGFVLAIALAVLHQVLAADAGSAAAQGGRALMAAAQKGD